jgi:hypothetical protein
MEAALAAAAGEVLVAVDEARHHRQAGSVDDFDVAGQRTRVDMRGKMEDLAATDENVGPAPILGGVDGAVADEFHGHP